MHYLLIQQLESMIKQYGTKILLEHMIEVYKTGNTDYEKKIVEDLEDTLRHYNKRYNGLPLDL